MKSDRSFFFLIGVVVLSRIPLLSGGFGTDGDSWRVAKTALSLWNDGVYHVSRFPGFPLYEILQAPIITLGGSAASNFATLVAFIISIVIMRKVIEHWNINNGDILLIVYSFLPILWKNSAVTMDYIWGLLGILLTVHLLMKKQWIAAGMILGLAAGTRLSHIVYILPLLFAFEKSERKQWFKFSLIAVGTAFICYIPALLSEDYILIVKDFLNDVGGYSLIKRFGVITYRIVFTLGLFGWIGIAALVVHRRRAIAGVFSTNPARISAAMCFTGVALFFLLPDEREYLIPTIPFGLIVLSLIAERKQFILLTIVFISYGFISIDVIEHNIQRPRLDLNIQRGYVVKEYLGRKEINEQRMRLSNAEIPDSSFVMVGMGPMFWLENPSVQVDPKIEMEFRHDCAKRTDGKEIYFIYALYKPQLDEIRRRGYSVYYWTEMKDYLDTFIGYDMTAELIRPLETSR